MRTRGVFTLLTGSHSQFYSSFFSKQTQNIRVRNTKGSDGPAKPNQTEGKSSTTAHRWPEDLGSPFDPERIEAKPEQKRETRQLGHQTHLIKTVNITAAHTEVQGRGGQREWAAAAL